VDTQEPFGPQVGGSAGEYSALELLARSDPDAAWARLVLIAARTDDAGLFWVADILEDLISFHGHEIYERLKGELEVNPALREAFVSVVPDNADPDLEDRLLVLRDKIEAELEAN